MSQVKRDLQTLCGGGVLNLEAQELKRALERYKGRAGGFKTAAEKVDLLLLVAEMLGWDENEFRQFTDQLNRVLLKNDTGIDPAQFDKMLNKIEQLQKKGKIH